METGMTISLCGEPTNGYDVVVRDVVDREYVVHTPDADGALFAFKTLCKVLGSLIHDAEKDTIAA
jgi:hypothetical protein